MKVAVGLRRVAAGKRTSGRRAAQIATFSFSSFFLLYYILFNEYVSILQHLYYTFNQNLLYIEDIRIKK